jgi:proton glutamate symport protein
MRSKTKKNKIALHWKIVFSIFLACCAGLLTNMDDNIYGITYYSAYSFGGILFLNALKMIIVPLVVSSIIAGVAKIGSDTSLGRMGGKTMLFFFTTTTVAIFVGLLMVNALSPGIVNGSPAGELFGVVQLDTEKIDHIGDKGFDNIVEIFHHMVPSNIVHAAGQGNMLGLIFFSLLFGAFLAKSKSEHVEVMYKFWQVTFETMMSITLCIMQYIAPIGIFCLVAKTMTETGFSTFRPLLVFFITVILALSIHMFIILPLYLKLFAKVQPKKHFRAMLPAILTAFSTASSAATLPVTIECVEENANVSNKISSFVLPLGATINMNGTALYECVVVIFLMQVYGIEISFAKQLLVVVLALTTSIGVAGVPAASLVALVIILNAIGLPAESIGIIMITERLLDMFKTTVNIFSDTCGAVIIAHTEGEKNLLPDKMRI